MLMFLHCQLATNQNVAFLQGEVSFGGSSCMEWAVVADYLVCLLNLGCPNFNEHPMLLMIILDDKGGLILCTKGT